MRARAARTIDELKPPHRPRSDVVTTSRWVRLEPVPTSILGAFPAWPTLSEMARSMRSMRSA